MMDASFYFRDKIPVAIIGVNSDLGKRLIDLLNAHPWFQIAALYDTKELAGQFYHEIIQKEGILSNEIASIKILSYDEPLHHYPLVFSVLDSSSAEFIELHFAQNGSTVLSVRDSVHSPILLLVGEVNGSNLDEWKKPKDGYLVACPSDFIKGITLSLKPLIQDFGVEMACVHPLQVLSEKTVEIQESCLSLSSQKKKEWELKIMNLLHCDSSHCLIESLNVQWPCQQERNHPCIGKVCVKLKTEASPQAILNSWQHFSGEPQAFHLPMAPLHPLYYVEQDLQSVLAHPLDKGMAMILTKLHSDSSIDYQFIFLSHPSSLGIAGTAILNAELLVKKGFVYW
jgi:aspartate-semialdehyde dehydrogenase